MEKNCSIKAPNAFTDLFNHIIKEIRDKRNEYAHPVNTKDDNYVKSAFMNMFKYL